MTKTETIYKQIEDKLDANERQVLCSIFGIGKNRAKTEEELKNTVHSDGEGIREIIRSALTKCEKEIKEMQLASKIFISKNIWVKMGDTVDLCMHITEPELDKEKNEYMCNYFIGYWHNDKEFSDYYYDANADEYYEHDIRDFTKDNLEEDTGISEYEIMDFDTSADTACVTLRVKCIGKSWTKFGKNKYYKSEI